MLTEENNLDLNQIEEQIKKLKEEILEKEKIIDSLLLILDTKNKFEEE